MPLRLKVVITVMVLAVTLFSVTYGVSRAVFARSYQALEARNTRDDVERVGAALSARLAALHALNLDWAAWDDIYAFVQDPGAHQAYINANAMDTTFGGAGVNALLFLDGEGRVVFSRTYNVPSTGEAALQQELARVVAPGTLQETKGRDGAVMLSGGPAIMSVLPITNSGGGGPPAGTLVMAQLMDESFLRQLTAGTLGVAVGTIGEEASADFLRAAAATRPASFRNSLREIGAGFQSSPCFIAFLLGR
jgi:sensor domain CHASE-containing protein